MLSEVDFTDVTDVASVGSIRSMSGSRGIVGTELYVATATATDSTAHGAEVFLLDSPTVPVIYPVARIAAH